ncbi:MAG: hypothetical protein D6731_21105 [Planctomycetota bacterium]|nr:MAG: hypothetical protein D6731_21105 [Planctomycetota bacterium]
MGGGEVCAASPALAWKFGPEKLRYELTLAGAPPAGVVFRPAPFRLVGAGDVEGGRPRLEVHGPEDLLWFYALALPRGEWPARKRRPLIEAVDDRFSLRGGAELRVQGNQSARRRGRRADLRSSLVVRGSGAGFWLSKGVLTLRRRFDLKAGRLLRADFSFEWTPTAPGSAAVRLEGRIALARGGAAGKPGARDFHVRVQEAIDRGARWLERRADEQLAAAKAQPSGPHTVGRLALPCFALLRSGVSPARLEKHVAWLRNQPFRATYDVSLVVLVLEALHVERQALPPRPRTRSVARFRRGQVPADDRELMERAARWLAATRKRGEGWWSYFGDPEGKSLGHDGKTVAARGDRSNSQFAVLALHAAAACGVQLPPEVWEEVLEEVLGSQQAKGPERSLEGSLFGRGSPLRDDPRDVSFEPGQTIPRDRRASPAATGERRREQARGWGYSMRARPAKGGATGSMTAAGVSSLAAAREALLAAGRLSPERAEESLARLRDGLAWLLERYDAGRNPGSAAHYYYYAYSFEKAMDTTGVERLGPREWWRDFAAELLARQDAKGSWEQNPVETSFALLVLNRATLPVELEIGPGGRRATGRRDPARWDRVTVPGTGELSVRQLLEALRDDPASAAERLGLARKALAALPEAERPRVLPELAQLLEHPHRKTARWARESVRRLAGSDDPRSVERFCLAYERLRAAGEALDHGAIEEARGVLRAPLAVTPLRRMAARTLARLRAVEAVPDLIELLADEDEDLARGAADALTALTGTEPEGASSARDPRPAWRAWWEREGPALVARERVRRAVGDLAFPGRREDAAQRLRALGKAALRGLVDGLRSDATRAAAHRLLEEISGEHFAADPDEWLEWLEAREGR